jgi:hypothetical protein
MFGKILGGLIGGVLEKIGLGKIVPFVKMGINALTGNWLGVAKDVFDMVSGFKSNFMDGASKKPPLGGFEDFSRSFNGESKLNGNRISGFMRGLKNLFGGVKALLSGDFRGFGKIFNAFNTLRDFFNNNQLYTNRQSSSYYNSISV